jgi:hypothetical protein
MLPIAMSLMTGTTAGGDLQVHVKADGSVWVPAEAYAELLDGKVELQNNGKLVVFCVGDLCVPLQMGKDAEVIDGTTHARLDYLRSALAGTMAAPAPAAGLRPGDMAPDFTLISLDGKPVSLRDYRGRKVLVFAWASW